jgi:HSP20 family molecular chaperone IbpA
MEITVTMDKDSIIVEGNHDEQVDHHGYIERTFRRRFVLPQNIKDEDIHCDLSSDGVLLIRIPRSPTSHHEPGTKLIPIEYTGKPSIEFNCPYDLRDRHPWARVKHYYGF